MGATALAQERLFALREAIARIEGKPLSGGLEPVAEPCAGRSHGGPPVRGRKATGLENLLPEGFPKGAMVEARGAQFRDAGAVSGFGLGLCLSARPARPNQRILWIGDRFVARETGLPYAPGLADAALSCGAFSAVMLEVGGNPRGFGLTESRRLSLKAKSTGGFLLLVRQGGEEEASSASLRLLVEPAPAAARLLPDGSMLGGSIGHSVFRLVPEKSRLGAHPELILEWNRHDRQFYPATPVHAGARPVFRPARPGALATAPVDRPAGAPALGAVVAFDRAS